MVNKFKIKITPGSQKIGKVLRSIQELFFKDGTDYEKASMKKIAITGNIGSGKTTISNILLHEGYEVFQCDKEISKLYLCSDLKKEIKIAFNNKVENLFFRNGKISQR